MDKTVRTRVTDLPASFWWLWLAALVTAVGGFVVPFLTIFLTSVAGSSATAAGAAISGYGAGVMVASLVGGVLVDRLGRKRILVASQIASVVVLVVIPQFIGSLWTLVPLLVLYGLVNGAVRPSIATLIGDIVATRHRHTAYTYFTWANNLGWAIGPILAGLLVHAGYAVLFYGQATVIAIAAVVVSSLIRDPGGHSWRVGRNQSVAGVPLEALPGAGQFAGGQSTSLAAVLRDKVFLAFMATNFLYFCAYGQFTSTLPVVMTSEGLSARDYGLMISVNGLLICVLQIPSLRLFARRSHSNVMVVSLGFTTAGMIVQAVAAADLRIYLLAVVLWTLGELGFHPSSQTTSMDLAIARLRGRYQGAYDFVGYGAFYMAAPILGGAVLDWFGSQVVWLACAAMCLLAAVVLAAASPKRGRRIAGVTAINARASEAALSKPYPAETERDSTP